MEEEELVLKEVEQVLMEVEELVLKEVVVEVLLQVVEV